MCDMVTGDLTCVTGTAYRACTCTATRCRWQEPNFANCSTIELDQLNNEVRNYYDVCVSLTG